MCGRLGSTDEGALEDKVSRLITEYLTEHPHAMDTAEGVGAWWICSECLRADLATTRRVLERLAGSGYLVKIGEGEHARFGLPKHPKPH